MRTVLRIRDITAHNESRNSAANLGKIELWLKERPILVPLLISVMFFLLCLPNLNSPSMLYFDEQIYVKAAQDLSKNRVINREHPMLAKEIMAAFLQLFGSNWASIRFGSVVWGALGLFGFLLAAFRFTRSQAVTAVFGVLVTANCLLLTTSRMAMLDPFMIGFAGLSAAFFARAMTEERWRLTNFVAAGAAIGLSLACKWSIAPFALCLGLAAVIRFRQDLRKVLLFGGAFGLAAALTYAPTFAPLLYDVRYPLRVEDFVILHRVMAERLALLLVDHPYTSEWWSWPLGGGQMWLYDGLFNKGDSRIVILGQNPLAAVITVPTVIWGLQRGFTKNEWFLTGSSMTYCAIILFWFVAGKPIMFIYHYNVALIISLFIGSVAIMRLFERGWRGAATTFVVAYTLVFVWTLPAISGIGAANVRPFYRDLPFWSVNPEARNFEAVVGNANELGLWSDRCLDNPRIEGCLDHRRNNAQEPQA